jgi:hypothetical protein
MPTEAAHFPVEIEDTLQEVRDQCNVLIDALCGAGARAKDVSDRLEVHAKLGWQLWNVAYSPPLTALRFLPNSHGIKTIAEAAEAKGLPPAIVEKLRRAADELIRVMETHAEDREMFEMLVDARESSNEEAELKWRKQAFAGNSFTFGARAKCMLASAILFPAQEAGSFSLARLHGLIEIVRTRAGIRWPFANLVVQHGGGSHAPGREPLDLNARGVPLLPEYCSKPLPPIERRIDGDMVSDELLPGPVGLTGASTVFTGEILHKVGPVRGSRAGEVAHFGTGIRTPSELLVSDHIVHRDLFPGAKRDLRIFSELVSPTTRDDRDLLTVSEHLQHLGRGLDRVMIADVPRYAELLEETFSRIGQNPGDFDVYRVRMRFPPIPTSVMVRFNLPSP